MRTDRWSSAGVPGRAGRWLAVGLAAGLAGLATACQPPVLDLTVTSHSDAPAANPGDGICEATSGAGDCTLRAAIDEANAVEGPVVIRLPEGVYPLSLAGVDDDNAVGDLDVSGTITVRGPGIIDAAGVDRAFDVTGSLTLHSTTVRGGHADGDGGAVLVRDGGSLSVMLSTITDNTATGSGGAVAVSSGGTASVQLSTIDSNTAGTMGGGVHIAPGATAVISSSTISANAADPNAPFLGEPAGASLDPPVLGSGTDATGATKPTDGLAAPATATATATDTLGPELGPDGDALIPVIVELSTGPLPGDPAGPGRDRRSEHIGAVAEAVMSRAEARPGRPPRTNRTYEALPFVALSVDEAALEALQADPAVVSVQPDTLAAPTLAQSVPWIGADLAHDTGITGAGSVVVIIDSGVDPSKPMTTGKVVAEACFARGSDGATGAGDCPNGSHSQVGAGSGGPCAWLDLGCWHGTHVASIAVGAPRTVSGVPHSGVAPGADMASVNVFSRFTSDSICGAGNSPCIRTWTSDQLAAFDWILAQTATLPVAAVNMSLGGGAFTDACDSDPRATPIGQLRALGVLTVTSSGNSGSKTTVSAPACISTIVAVGATFATTDAVAGFSQSAPALDLLAPGVSITGEYPMVPGQPGADYVITASGTSQASPHVAGAVALLVEAGVEDPDTIESALASTGVPVTDTNGITRPRIDVPAALAAGTGNGTGGGIANEGSLTLRYVTVTNNAAWWGGGLYSSGATDVAAAIVASQASGSDCSSATGPAITSAGHNLDSDATCWSGPTDLVAADPLLGPLTDNGGPTLTHRPGPGSPASDAIAIDVPGLCDGSAYTIDQRVAGRPQGAGCDIGSVDF